MHATCGANEQLRPRRRMRAASPATVGNTRRRWTASTAACLVGVALARLQGAAVDAAATTARADGVTYCWQVGGSAYASVFNSSTSIQQGQQDECAVTLAMQLSKDTFYVGEAIQATWTATLRRDGDGAFLPNKFGVQEVFVAPDRVTQKPYAIVLSRVESCDADATDCDPVVGNTSLVANVANKPANFSDAGAASFSTDRIAFSTAGKMRLVAHVVLPGSNPEQGRFDFALYKTIVINERPTLSPVRNESGSSQSEKDADSSKSKGGGLSTQVIGIMFVCGMVAVALVAVGFVMIRKNKAELAPPSISSQKGSGPDGRTRQDASSTDLDDEFAMLSNEERFMMSQGVGQKKNASGGFLSATAQPQPSLFEESRAMAKAKGQAPLPYVGSASTRGPARQAAADSDLASDDHIVDTSNPASMRHHGLYVEMAAAQPAPQLKRPSQKIFYNDIRDDEIVGHAPSRRGNANASGMGSTMNPYASARLVAGASPTASTFGAEPLGESHARWRPSTELTFDDLRPSADLGPALTLDDLLENQHKKRGVSDSISEVSRG